MTDLGGGVTRQSSARGRSQGKVIDRDAPWGHFPKTRYQGSKRRFLSWLDCQFSDLSFESALDLFGGTGAVSYLLKARGKTVTYNDGLRFNEQIGRALIENDAVVVTPSQVEAWLSASAPRGGGPSGFIQDTFEGIYFLDDENAWLDRMALQLSAEEDLYARAIGYYALFQSCLAKRPFALFHRKNLEMRTRKVTRSFGNKTSWDRPFAEHFSRFVVEANRAVFDSGRRHRALCTTPDRCDVKADLVYIDPPYVDQRGKGVDYLGFYHFLEGLSEYPDWPSRVDYRKKHRPYRSRESGWLTASRIKVELEQTFERFRESILVVSYRADGVPDPETLASMLRSFKPRVRWVEHVDHRYVLSARASRELLFIAE